MGYEVIEEKRHTFRILFTPSDWAEFTFEESFNEDNERTEKWFYRDSTMEEDGVPAFEIERNTMMIFKAFINEYAK